MSMIGNFVAIDDAELASLRAAPEGITEFLYGDRELRALAVDKAWHGIHFLLTGEAWTGEPPFGFIMSGDPIGEVDVGYGPARALTSEEVAAVSEALAGIDRAKLMSAWDSEAIRSAELYAINPDDCETEAEYLGTHYESLKAFLAAAASDGLALLIYLN